MQNIKTSFLKKLGPNSSYVIWQTGTDRTAAKWDLSKRIQIIFQRGPRLFFDKLTPISEHCIADNHWKWNMTQGLQCTNPCPGKIRHLWFMTAEEAQQKGVSWIEHVSSNYSLDSSSELTKYLKGLSNLCSKSCGGHGRKQNQHQLKRRGQCAG